MNVKSVNLLNWTTENSALGSCLSELLYKSILLIGTILKWETHLLAMQEIQFWN